LKAKGHLKYLIGALVVVAAVAFLVYNSTMSAMVYYVTVSELKSQGVLQSGPVRVAGHVVEAPVADAAGNTLSFTIQESSDTLPVVVKGPLPDGVKAGADVVVEGQLNSAGVFEGSKVLAKCPSKYEVKVQ
jgi:cytochrome c-type biogenesis protein CcmE